MAENAKTLTVHSIESFGTHDGPGIRMVLFLQGCTMKCLYCHNPDTIPMEGGNEHDIEDLVRRACNMKTYFRNKGGVTVSGGEPMVHSKQLIPFFKRLKEEGIHTNIDTNGTILTSAAKELLDEYADLVMLDVKHFDPVMHEKMVGEGRKVEQTLKFAKYREESGKPMWLRYVLVPGYTDNEDHLHAMGKHFKDYNTIEKIEIQPYHKLGNHKWESMGWEYPLEGVEENTPEQIEKAKAIFAKYFKEVKVN